MKKGQKVRVLADNRVGTIADKHLINLKGKRHLSIQVQFPDTKGEAPWFPSEQLTTNLHEKARIDVITEKGCVHWHFSFDHERSFFNIGRCYVDNPGITDVGIHTLLVGALKRGLDSLAADSLEQ